MSNEKDIPDGCEPFDLIRALNGERVVTRDGRDFKLDKDPIKGVIDGEIYQSFTVTGSYHTIQKESNLDLFMAKKTKTVWVNLYLYRYAGDPGLDIKTGYWFYSEKKAKENTNEFCLPKYLKTISIEVLEEVFR